MRGFSKVIITGNLTRDPEVRTTPSGAQVTGFGVAVNRGYRDASGNLQEQVSFFDCSAWNKIGETIAQYAKKGSAVLVSGRLEQHSWDDKTTGQKRSRVEIVVEDFNFIGGRSDDNGGGSYGGGSYRQAAPAPVGDGAQAQSQDNAPEDIPDNIDLTDIPF